MTNYIRCVLVLMTAVVAAGCTMTDIEPPPLAGPVRDEPVARDLRRIPTSCRWTARRRRSLRSRRATATGSRRRMCRSASRFSRMARLSTSGRFRRARWSLGATAARRLPTPRRHLSAGHDSKAPAERDADRNGRVRSRRSKRHGPAGTARRHRRRAGRQLYVFSVEPGCFRKCAL